MLVLYNNFNKIRTNLFTFNKIIIQKRFYPIFDKIIKTYNNIPPVPPITSTTAPTTSCTAIVPYRTQLPAIIYPSNRQVALIRREPSSMAMLSPQDALEARRHRDFVNASIKTTAEKFGLEEQVSSNIVVTTANKSLAENISLNNILTRIRNTTNNATVLTTSNKSSLETSITTLEELIVQNDLVLSLEHIQLLKMIVKMLRDRMIDLEKQELLHWLAQANNIIVGPENFIGPEIFPGAGPNPPMFGPNLSKEEHTRRVHEQTKQKYNIPDAVITNPYVNMVLKPIEQAAMANYDVAEQKTFSEVCFPKAFTKGTVITVEEYFRKLLFEIMSKEENAFSEELIMEQRRVTQIVALERVIRDKNNITILDKHINISIINPADPLETDLASYSFLTSSKNMVIPPGVPSSIWLSPKKYIEELGGNKGGAQYCVMIKVPLIHDPDDLRINIPVTRYLNQSEIKTILLDAIEKHKTTAFSKYDFNKKDINIT